MSVCGCLLFRVDISDTLMYVYEMLGAELLSNLYDKLGRLLTNTEQPTSWQVGERHTLQFLFFYDTKSINWWMLSFCNLWGLIRFPFDWAHNCSIVKIRNITHNYPDPINKAQPWGTMDPSVFIKRLNRFLWLTCCSGAQLFAETLSPTAIIKCCCASQSYYVAKTAAPFYCHNSWRIGCKVITCWVLLFSLSPFVFYHNLSPCCWTFFPSPAHRSFTVRFPVHCRDDRCELLWRNTRLDRTHPENQHQQCPVSRHSDVHYRWDILDCIIIFVVSRDSVVHMMMSLPPRCPCWMAGRPPGYAQQRPALSAASFRKPRSFCFFCLNTQKNLQGMQIWPATIRNQHSSSFSGLCTVLLLSVLCDEIQTVHLLIF